MPHSSKNVLVKTSNNQVRFHTVDENHVDQRIDNFLITMLKGVPKSAIYRIIRKGEVRVNKGRINVHYKLQMNDVVRIPPVRVSESKAPELSLEKLANVKRLKEDIIYEDDYIIIVNKYSGIAVHGGSGISYGVIEGLRKLYPSHQFLELVHRIDRDTSGILMIAKKRSALKNMQEQLAQKVMRKEYLALVHGNFTDKSCSAPLERYEKLGERFVKVSAAGKASETRFKIEQRYNLFANELTLIRAFPITGRTHQIRVHCLHLGSSIVGDTKYASKSELEFDKSLPAKRLFLHAARLTFKHPHTQEMMTFEAKLDSVCKEILKNLAKFI